MPSAWEVNFCDVISALLQASKAPKLKKKSKALSQASKASKINKTPKALRGLTPGIIVKLKNIDACARAGISQIFSMADSYVDDEMNEYLLPPLAELDRIRVLCGCIRE